MNEVHDDSASPARAALKQRLVAAAEAAIDAGGLAGLRARDLAQAAGCAVGAIYTAFADLDGLIIAVNARTQAALDAMLAEAMARAPDATPAAMLGVLAEAYLDFVLAHTRRWDALFTHRMTQGQQAPEWFVREQEAMFARVEAPIRGLCPGLPDGAVHFASRSLFSAVHGVIALGLDQRLTAVERDVLRAQVRMITRALAIGLAEAITP